MKRVVLTGSESTGKSKLAADLAEHFHAPLVPEYLRLYVDEHEGRLGRDDIDAVATGQVELEEQIMAGSRGAPELIVLDTDLLSTVVYNHHYYGHCPPWIEKHVRDRAGDLYLLTDIDVPWIPDPHRDRGERREEMHRLFREALERYEVPHLLISGSWEQRRRRAIAAIEELLEP